MTASSAYMFLFRWACAHGATSSPSAGCWYALCRSLDNSGTQSVSRNWVWLDEFSRSRLANNIKQSSTTWPPSDKDPSAAMMANIFLKASSKATSF